MSRSERGLAILGILAIIAGIAAIAGSGFWAGWQASEITQKVTTTTPLAAAPTPTAAATPVTPTISTSACPANNGFATYLQSHTKADNPFSKTIPVAGNPAAVLGVANAVGGIENGTVPNDIEDFDNEGDIAGHVTVGFGTDIKGQVKIYFKDFNRSENEAFNVLASPDGINFTLIGSAVPTETAPHRLESRTFDMAAAGVESAKYIRVQNVFINNTPVTQLDSSGANEGVDLDAIQALDCVVGTSKFQCEDGADNDGDKLADALDPGCHSDRNPENAATYQPADDNENDSAPDTLITPVPAPVFDPGGVKEID